MKGRPEGCAFYAEDVEKGFRFVAWNPPPTDGDVLCLGTIGCTESQLVQDILDGKYDHIFCR